MTSRTTLRRACAVVALLLASGALAGCTLPETGIGGPLPGAAPDGEVDAFAIAVGDCLNDASIADTVETVPFVHCSEPHDSEVFAVTDLPDGDFPGDAAVENSLVEFCSGDAFAAFVGIPYADSMYDVSGYFPTAQSWADGDRELLCTIFDPAGQVSGSLAGINA